MTNKTTLLRTFNTHFFEFLDDIIRIFPENLDIQTTKTAFTTTKQANPTILIKTWVQHVYIPYKDAIDKGDVDFFFKKDYSSDLSDLPNVNEVMNIIDKLREPFSNMTEKQKEFSAEYVKNLSKLAVLYTIQ
jgi:hypothetical protein